MNHTRIRIGAAVALIIPLWASVFTVSETDTAIVTLFGRPTRTFTSAGLQFKWPVESVSRFVGGPHQGQEESRPRLHRLLAHCRRRTLRADGRRRVGRRDAVPRPRVGRACGGAGT